MARHKFTKAEQIQGIKKALANRRTPRQFIPSLKKRLRAVGGAAIWLLGLGLLVFPSSLKAQTCPPGFSPLPWGVTRDQVTDERREIFCQDKNGYINMSAIFSGILDGIPNANSFPGATLDVKINNAIASLPGNGVVKVTASGNVAATVTIPAGKNIRIECHKKEDTDTTLTWTGGAGGTMFDARATQSFELVGCDLNGNNLAATAVLTTGAATQRYFFKISDVSVRDFTGTLFDINKLSDSLFENVKMKGGQKGIGNDLQNNTCVHCDIQNMTNGGLTGAGIGMAANSKWTFLGGHFSGNNYDIEINASGFSAFGTWFENSTQGILRVPFGVTFAAPFLLESCWLHTFGASLIDFTSPAAALGDVVLIGNRVGSTSASATVVFNAGMTRTVRGNQNLVLGGSTGFSEAIEPNGLNVFVKGAGSLGDSFHLFDTTPAAPTPSKWFRVAAGCLQIMNDAFTTQIFGLCDTGVATIPNISTSTINLGSGMNNNAGGFKHSRTQAGCATAATAGAACDSTVSWSTAFADANYSPVCHGFGVTSGVPLNGAIVSKVAGSTVFRTVAATAVAAEFTNIYCVAVHD